MGESNNVPTAEYKERVQPYLNDIAYWVLIGYTNKEIYEKLGICHDSFYTYRNKYTEFADALKKYRPLPNTDVVNALHKRATGYKYEEVRTTRRPAFDSFGKPVYDKDGKVLMIEEVTTSIKHLPGETKAMQTWLLNRDRDNWKLTSGHKVEESKTTDNQAIDKVFDLLDEARKELNKDKET
jgi:hypothetical protein